MIWDGEWPWHGIDLCLSKKNVPHKKGRRKVKPKELPEMKNQIETQAQNRPVDGQAIFVSPVAWIWIFGMCSIFIVVGTKKKQRLNSFFMKLMKEQTEVKPKSFFFIIVIVDVLLVVSSQFIPCLLSCPLDKTKASLPTKWKKNHSLKHERTHRLIGWRVIIIKTPAWRGFNRKNCRKRCLLLFLKCAPQFRLISVAHPVKI